MQFGAGTNGRAKAASSNMAAAAKVQSLVRNTPKLANAVSRLQFLLSKLLGGCEMLQGCLTLMAASICQDAAGVLRCNRCDKRLCGTIHLSIHECKDMEMSSNAMEDAGLVTSGGHCALCGRFVGIGTHKCNSRFFNTFALDCSALQSGCITVVNFMEAQLSQLLRMSGTPLTVMVGVRCPQTQELVVLPYLLGPSEGKGMGLYAGETIEPGDIMMYYTGVPLDTPYEQQANEDWLVANKNGLLSSDSDKYKVTVKRGKQIDPTACGGTGSMLNCGHDAVVNVSVQESKLHSRPGQVMFSARRVQAGEELFWDYNWVTDDPDDPVLFEKCRCHAQCKKQLARLKKKRV